MKYFEKVISFLKGLDKKRVSKSEINASISYLEKKHTFTVEILYDIPRIDGIPIRVTEHQ